MSTPVPRQEAAVTDLNTARARIRAKQEGLRESKAEAARAEAEMQNRVQETVNVLSQLVDLEVSLREATTRNEIELFAVNELRALTKAKQIMVFGDRANPSKGKAGLKLRALSGAGRFDPNAPLVRGLEVAVNKKRRESDQCENFNLKASLAGGSRQEITYPYENAVIIPLLHGEQQIGHMLFTREEPWQEGDVAVVQHGVGMINHALATQLPKPRPKTKYKSFISVGVALLVLAALIFIKVPLTALAPVEIVPAEPIAIASPLDGVVREMLVEPNQMVKAGAPLVQIEDTDLRNQLEIAEREIAVAQAKYDGALHSSFTTVEARREMMVAQSALAKAQAERDYAQDRYSKTTINTGFDGLAIYADANDWRGKPVARGERILEIADPQKVRLRIELPVADSIALQENAEVRVYLDADPLNTLAGEVDYGSYHASPTANDVLAYRVYANLSDQNNRIPRIGLRGTAQVYGENVSLWFYLFRRPISTLRQWVGW